MINNPIFQYLNPVADDWKKSLLKYHINILNNGKNSDNSAPVLSLTTSGVIVKKDLTFGKTAQNYTEHQIVKENNIVFTPRDFDQTPILVGTSPTYGCISNLYIIFEGDESLDNRYIVYYLYALKYEFDYFKKLSFGLRYSFNQAQFKDTPVLVPPLKKQKLIVNYLDLKINQINQIFNDVGLSENYNFENLPLEQMNFDNIITTMKRNLIIDYALGKKEVN